MAIKVCELKLHVGSNTWHARVNKKDKYFGVKGGSKEDAQTALDAYVAELQEQDKTTEELTKGWTLNDYKNNYYEERTDWGTEKNSYNAHRACDAYCAKFGTMKPTKVKSPMVESWLETQLTWNDNTKVQMCKHITKMYNYMIASEKLTYNPVRWAKKPISTARQANIILTKEEFDKVLPIILPKYKEIIEIWWETGARPSEILGATVEEYIKSRRVLDKVHHKTKKKGRIRPIPLNKRAIEIVESRIAKVGSGLLWKTRDGKEIAHNTIRTALMTAFKRAGLDGKKICYSFRHGFCARHLERGVPLKTVAAWMGNTTAVCERHYAHALDLIGETIDRLDDD